MMDCFSASFVARELASCLGGKTPKLSVVEWDDKYAYQSLEAIAAVGLLRECSSIRFS
jgi:hypothetical protein